MTRIAITCCGSLLLPAVAAAHPDHASGGDFGLLHFVSDPFHVGLAAAAALTALALGRALRRRRALERSQG